MKIRPMEENDYDEIYQMWTQTPGMGLNHLDDSKEGIAKFIRRNPTTCFVSEEDGKLIGVILCGHDGRRAYIYHTAVLQTERSRGIGKALVEASLKALQQEGIHKTALVVFRKNEIGNHFWEKQGFEMREDLVYRNKALVELERIDI